MYGYGYRYGLQGERLNQLGDELTDGTTIFTFGMLTGDLGVYYTESEQVVRRYKNA